MSVKRRRGIGIRKWLVAALRDHAKKEGLPTHTAAANKILRGKTSPIKSYEQYKNGGDDTKQGVSMPESLWLALKAYREARGRGENDTQLACKIIVGKVESIPKRYIDEGEFQARDRESKRSTVNEPPKKKPEKKKPEKKKPAKKKPKKKPSPPPVAVKEKSQEIEIIESRTEEKLDEYGRALSKGAPFDKNGGHSNREIDPDDDHFGGVFNM